MISKTGIGNICQIPISVLTKPSTSVYGFMSVTQSSRDCDQSRTTVYDHNDLKKKYTIKKFPFLTSKILKTSPLPPMSDLSGLFREVVF